MRPTNASDPPAGLLDGDERAVAGPDPTAPGDAPGGMDRATAARLAGAVGTLVALVLAAQFVPALEWARPWRGDEGYVPFWNVIGRELMGRGQAAARDEAELARLEAIARAAEADEDPGDAPLPDRPTVAPPATATYPPYAPHADDEEQVAVALEGAERLDAFYAALARTDLGLAGAVTRVGHWGDSVLGNDGITGAIRRRAQARFGDAGHGFHALSRYNLSYRHQGVRFDERSEWSRCVITHGCRRDGHYGYGGVIASSAGGAESRIRTATEGAVGRRFSRFELWYAGQPRGGRIRVTVDDGEPQVVETAADRLEDRWFALELSDGPHEVSVRAAGGGSVRTYGLVLERSGPGIVWDELSLIGSFVSRLSAFEPGHLARQLDRRRTDLVVFTFGGNDMESERLLDHMEEHEAKYAAVVRAFRAARPAAACLIVSPVDHGERRGNAIVSRAVVAPMVHAQRRVAAQEGCAFFDLFQAMGGEGSMGRWSRSEPRLGSGDLAHPTAAGHRVIGQLVYAALVRGYADFRRRVAGRPLPAASVGE